MTLLGRLGGAYPTVQGLAAFWEEQLEYYYTVSEFLNGIPGWGDPGPEYPVVPLTDLRNRIQQIHDIVEAI